MTGTALIADSSVPITTALKRYLEVAGMTVKVVHYLDDALERVRKDPPDLLMTSASESFDGGTLCREAKKHAHPCAVILLYPPDAEDADEHAVRMGADAYLVGTLKRGTVVSCAQTMMRMRSLNQNLEKLEKDLRKHVADPPADVEEVEGSSADFNFFKKYLLMEVKRSRRYKYPVSFLLIGLDNFAEQTGELNLDSVGKNAALAEALNIVTRGVRDIDLAVPSGENRFLVFLPHTPREGALFVATRLHERLGKMKQLGESTASIGLASYDPATDKKQISFGSLMKDATEALRKAQLEGGNRVEAGVAKKKKERISLA